MYPALLPLMRTPQLPVASTLHLPRNMVYPALLSVMRTPQLPVASTLHTTSEHGVPSITTADVHISAAGSQYPSHYLGTWCIQHYYR